MLACALSWARAGERVNRGETGRGESGARPRPARYIERMQYVLPALVVIAMLATLGTLFLGIISMAKGGNPQHSNKLMRSRVLLQGAALVLFVIFMLIYRHG